MTAFLFTATLLLCAASTATNYALTEARAFAGPGRGRHRRVTRGRHAARGGRR
jgi:hypothetical protein